MAAILPVLVFIGCLVAGIVLLLHREHRLLSHGARRPHRLVPDDRPHPGVQNHEGDR